jgi:hypothetical protein
MNIDKNSIFNSIDSEVFKMMKEKIHRAYFFAAHFYSYDGDGLIGHVRGRITANLR